MRNLSILVITSGPYGTLEDHSGTPVARRNTIHFGIQMARRETLRIVNAQKQLRGAIYLSSIVAKHLEEFKCWELNKCSFRILI